MVGTPGAEVVAAHTATTPFMQRAFRPFSDSYLARFPGWCSVACDLSGMTGRPATPRERHAALLLRPPPTGPGRLRRGDGHVGRRLQIPRQRELGPPPQAAPPRDRLERADRPAPRPAAQVVSARPGDRRGRPPRARRHPGGAPRRLGPGPRRLHALAGDRRPGLDAQKKALRAAERDRPDVAEARRRWRAAMPGLDPDRLVFV